jgi:hypothetical protein
MVTTARGLGPGASGIDLHHAFTDSFAEVAASLKHPSFAEEREWRLVGARKSFDTACYRATETVIVPYFSLSIIDKTSLPISRVIIGPHRYPGLARRSLHFMSAVKHGWPLKVDHSRAPYRLLG